MNELFYRNYIANVRRGQINDKTEILDFLAKLREEVTEVNLSYEEAACYVDPSELADVMLVCASLLIKLGKDPFREIEKKVAYNEIRR